MRAKKGTSGDPAAILAATTTVHAGRDSGGAS